MASHCVVGLRRNRPINDDSRAFRAAPGFHCASKALDGGTRQEQANAETIFRKVSSTSELWGYVGDRAQITVEFADGTPGRVFDMEDVVDVLNIVPGADFSTYRGGS